ncbi:MAG: hypothetical protein ACJ749_00360 [Flavisolibacter sp.]|jgi:hypothetical protein
MAASTTPRFGTAAGDDNTGRVITHDFKRPAYAATVNLKPNASKTFAFFATLTGAITINVDTSRAFAGDELIIVLASDGTSRTATLGTGTKTTSGTIAPAISKKASIRFVFDGTDWVEFSRGVMA